MSQRKRGREGNEGSSEHDEQTNVSLSKRELLREMEYDTGVGEMMKEDGRSECEREPFDDFLRPSS